LPLQIKSVQSLSDKAVISSEEGTPNNDVGESDMQIQITSVQGNVGKLYQDRQILPLSEDESIKINPIEIEGVEKAILQIKQQKTIKEINHAIFRSTRYTDEQIFNIIDEYTEDLTQICALAKKYSVAVQTIRNWAQVAGKRPPRKLGEKPKIFRLLSKKN
jgi:transposase-like protein